METYSGRARLEKDFEEIHLVSFSQIILMRLPIIQSEQFVDGIHFGEPYNEQSQLNQKLRELYLDKGYMEACS